MEELQKKWQSYGKIAGKITLKGSSDAEKRAIGGIIGKIFLSDQIYFTFLEFEQGLQRTKFAPLDMKEVLEQYFACELHTNQEQKTRKRNEKEKFFDNIFLDFRESMGNNSCAVRWISDMREFKKYGYQILLKEYESNALQANQLAKNVGKALARIEELKEEEEIFLAVLSADVSGNPHYFDMGKTAAQLLMNAICRWKDYEYPKNAYEWRSCMARVGILSDTIASMVHAYGVYIETKEGVHEAYEVFRAKKEPYVITAENLKTIVRASAVHNKVYVVENEMVFLYLLEHSKTQDITCLCTSGQLRVAAFGLLSLLLKSGATIFYSGDLDAEGMGIADRLWQKYGDAIQMWRMDEADYRAAISDESLNEKQLSSLKQLKNPQLQKTAKLVTQEKKAGYQENILNSLLGDFQNL